MLLQTKLATVLNNIGPIFLEWKESTLSIESELSWVWIKFILPKWACRSSQKNTQSYGSVWQSQLYPLQKIGP